MIDDLPTHFYFFQGCKKKKEEAPPFISYLKMDINGTRVENDLCIRASSYSSPPKLFGIAANLKPYIINQNANEWEIYDFMEAPGEYAFPMDSPLRTLVLFQPEGTYGAQSGKLTIVEVSKELIKGTFQFTTKVSSTGIQKHITNGEFHIKRALKIP
jgi:hypothetical protein